MTMIGKYKWLLVPPAAAVILFLGPLRNGAGAPTPKDAATKAVQEQGTPPEEGSKKAATPIEMPDMWQLASALLGVLLLGGAGIALLARLRNGATIRGGAVVTHRQSLRLASRQHLHAVEFDGSLLLLGEVDGKLTVLHTGSPPERIEEEAALAETAEEGAVPRNLLIPRPAQRPATRPKPPRTAAERVAERRRAAAELSDFRSLLRKVRAGQQV